jgi:hypothetical protein
MVTKASGTVHSAGWARRVSAHEPAPSSLKNVRTTANPEVRPPIARPARAPAAVSRCHQMPSTSSGQKVEAATAKASPDRGRHSYVGDRDRQEIGRDDRDHLRPRGSRPRPEAATRRGPG